MATMPNNILRPLFPASISSPPVVPAGDVCLSGWNSPRTIRRPRRSCNALGLSPTSRTQAIERKIDHDRKETDDDRALDDVRGVEPGKAHDDRCPETPRAHGRRQCRGADVD